jgi:hypothetical protein
MTRPTTAHLILAIKPYVPTCDTQSRKEWHLGLEGMPLTQRLAVLDLAFEGVGAWIDLELHPGLRRMLEPHLEKTADGLRYYLRDPHQRQILRVSG